jgi:hypothetical protein
MEIELLSVASANCTREQEGTMKVLDRPAAVPQQQAIQGRNERALDLLAIRARGQLKRMGSMMGNLFSLDRLYGWKTKLIALADIFSEWRRMRASLLRWLRQPVQMPRHYH